MKIVFMGTPKFAVPSLRKLIEAGYDIPMVVSQPDKKGNRNKVLPSAVKSLALEHNLNVVQPEKIRKNEEFLSELRSVEPDMIIVAAYGKILPQELLDIPKYGCINVHGSLLPKLRGAAPMQMSILEGYKETGVTIMKMEAGLDTGDMISSVSCNIEGLNITELSEKLAEAGAELLVETLPTIFDGTATYEKQNDDESTYAHMINKADGLTDFNEDADVLERKIRAYYEWPNLYSYLGDLQVKFYKAEALMDENPNGPVGTISDVQKDSYSINCKNGRLKIIEQQLQGKKRMSAADFMRGHKLSVGEKFEGR